MGVKQNLEYKYFYFFNFISEYNSFFALTPNHSLVLLPEISAMSLFLKALRRFSHHEEKTFSPAREKILIGMIDHEKTVEQPLKTLGFMKLLIIEDEASLRELMQRSLEKERYVVECAPDFRTAMQKIGSYDYDCVLLDIMLPDGSGLTVLEELKKMHKKENVIIISAKDSIEDKVAGLDLGADDYLAKPFHLAELSARIKSVIRRNHHGGENRIICGNIEVSPETFQVYINGKELELNRKEYDILLYFMNRPERLINKSTLAESVWGDHIDQVDNFDFIYAQIKNLRKKLKAAGATPEIKAVYGFGYKFTLEEA